MGSGVVVGMGDVVGKMCNICFFGGNIYMMFCCCKVDNKCVVISKYWCILFDLWF